MDPEHLQVTLYSRQAQAVWDAVERDGVAFSRRDYVKAKYRESAGIFLAAYDFFVREAVRYSDRPDGAEYPYWAFTDVRELGAPDGDRVMCLRVPAEEAVFFDRFDWYKILQLSYLGTSAEEEETFRRTLEKRGVRDCSDVILTPFYPDLKAAVQKSWKNLFRHDAAIRSGDLTGVRAVQAGLWRIRKDWFIGQPD